MKKTLAIFAILLMAFSSLAFAEGETPPPSEPTPPPSEPTPPSAEPTPPSEPAPAPETPPTEPNLPPALPPGEQPVPLQVPGGEPGSGGQPQPPQQPGMCYWDGKQIPCDQMPSNGEPSKQYPSQPGPGSGGCWVGEQQVPCPGEGQQNEGRQPQQPAGTNFMNPQNIPQGCKQVNNNGMINVVCDNAQRQPQQFDCTSGPDRERIEKECAAKGGRTVVRNMIQSKGCGIVDCVFSGASEGNFMPGQQQACPGPDELAKKEESCKSMGLNPKRMRSNCEFVQCEDPNKQNMQCPDNHDEWERVSQACAGKVVKAFDQNGCNIPQCVTEGQECPNNVPQEAYFKCEDQGGKLVVNSDENGCITFSKCVKRGEEGVQAEDELEEVPPAAKLLQVALKLESIKISFDQMSKQISAIADYYDNEGDDANAERFRTAAGMFESAKKQIDGVKEELKMGAKGMSVEQVIDIKHKIRQISDVVMEDALYVILGGEDIGSYGGADSEELPEFMPAATNDCGSDGNCFHKALRICMAGAAFSPDRNVNMKITGLEEGVCRIEGRANTPEGDKSMECKFADYATEQLTQETFMQHCGGSFVDYVKNNLQLQKAPQQQFSSEQAFQGQMMGCEKVDKGINKQGVCGNECCEARFGESNYNCPQDCMASQQIVKQPMVQRVVQAAKEDMGGCSDVINGLKPKDVCGNGCCEPNEGGNCLEDCNAMQRPPMGDEGRFFNEQGGPMVAPQQQFGQPPQYITPGGQMPVQGIAEMPPQEPVNIREGPIEPIPAQEGPSEVADSSVVEQTNEPVQTETSSGGGMIAGAAVAIDLLKEFLGR